MRSSEKTLYERIGGYDVITAMTDDLLERVTKDPQLWVYWKGHSNDNKRRSRQLIVDFLCEATGGPAIYTGRDMRTSHEGMGITESDWDVFIKHTVATLDKLELPFKEKEDCLAAVVGLKDDMVEKP